MMANGVDCLVIPQLLRLGGSPNIPILCTTFLEERENLKHLPTARDQP
jgi:hypothetical protein